MIKAIRATLSLAALLAMTACLHSASGPAAGAGPKLMIVRDGEPMAVIVARPDLYTGPWSPDKVFMGQVNLLVNMIEASTGVKLPIVSNAAPDQISIYLGQGPHLEAFGLDQPLGTDEFEIAFPDARSVVIRGHNLYGVYEFLERYVGVRWLMPGPAGTDVPKQTSLSIPVVTVRQAPSFLSRQLEVPRGMVMDWCGNNRGVTRQAGQAHNLNKLFRFEEAKANPEYFPLQTDGTRYTPTGHQGWQPCFDPSITATVAINRIVHNFNIRPFDHSYALSINDNGNYCRCAVCAPGLQGENYSETYYRWVNAVAEGVAAVHPGKFLGLLAYNNVIRPPEGPVNTNVVPFMTYDRLKWIDPELRKTGEELTRAWNAKVPNLAWYDYIYGKFYMLPRVYFHQLAETLRFGYDNGVRHYYAEAYPNFGEGPKLYVLLKLLWNKDADVDALLADWYERVGGKAAAPFLNDYYAFWEDFWTHRILQSPWFRQAGTYMPFFSAPDYLMDVTPEELARLDELMRNALAKAITPEQKQRVQTLADMHAFYATTALAYQAGSPRPVASAQEALKALDDAVRAVELNKHRQEMLATVFTSNAVLAASSGGMGFGADRGLFNLFTAAHEWAAANPDAAGGVLARMRELQDTYKGETLGDFAMAAVIVAESPDRLVEKARNGGFEGPEAVTPEPGGPEWQWMGVPAPWYKWLPAYAPNTKVDWIEGDAARAGSRCMKISGPGHAAVLQLVPVKPGEAFMVSVAFNATLDDTLGTAGMNLQWMRENRKWAGGSENLEIKPGDVTGGWVTRESTLIRAPEGVAFMVLNISLKTANPTDFLLVDDVSVKRVVMD